MIAKLDIGDDLNIHGNPRDMAILGDEFKWDFDLTKCPKETDALYNRVWEKYFLEDHQHEQSSNEKLDSSSCHFYFWGIRYKSNLIAAVSLVSLPLKLNSMVELPDEGWEWVCRQCFEKTPHNCLSLLSAAIDPGFQNKGLSKVLLQQVKNRAVSLEFSTLIAPVRPSHKSQFPRISMASYLEKKTKFSEIFDPWLRTHVNLGGRLLNICNRSIRISAPLKKWREWTGIELNDGASEFLPNQALNPVVVKNGFGVYVEPNVWVIYDLLNERQSIG